MINDSQYSQAAERDVFGKKETRKQELGKGEGYNVEGAYGFESDQDLFGRSYEPQSIEQQEQRKKQEAIQEKSRKREEQEQSKRQEEDQKQAKTREAEQNQSRKQEAEAQSQSKRQEADQFEAAKKDFSEDQVKRQEIQREGLFGISTADKLQQKSDNFEHFVYKKPVSPQQKEAEKANRGRPKKSHEAASTAEKAQEQLKNADKNFNKAGRVDKQTPIEDRFEQPPQQGREAWNESPINDQVTRGREHFREAIEQAERREVERPQSAPGKTERKVNVITEDEPGIISRIADKVVGYTERMVGRPVYQREEAEYKSEDARKKSLRKEVKAEEEIRSEEIEKAKQQEGKDMKDLESADQWQDILKNNDKPIVVDFYKQDCVNCRRLYPKLMDKFSDSKDKWVLLGANMEKVGDLGKSFEVEQVPTVVVFHKGKVVQQFKGLQDDKSIDDMMSKVHELSVK